MANSIDLTTLTLGALIGIGCRKQLKSAAKVTTVLAANLALATAEAVGAAASEVNRQAGQNGQPTGQAGQNGQNG